MRHVTTTLFFILFFIGLPTVAFTADGYFVVGDGSGGGGAGGNQGMNGAAGGGDNDTLDYSTSTNPNVIFGDGSGGGAGGRGVGFTNNVVVGGAGGGGADVITGGSASDIIFGDGFAGLNTADGVFYPGSGGLGGGGGGGAGGGFGVPPPGYPPGICGGGGGGGTVNGGTYSLLVACGNSAKGDASTGGHGGNGGHAATPESGSRGLGGAYSGSHGGGGGGFGGASGGTGVTAPTAGGTSQFRVVDTGNVIHSYFTEAVLRSVLTNYTNYGAGQDTINGKGGSNELFGLGGNDTFIVDSADSATRDRIWDFSAGDTLVLKTNGTVVATVDVNSVVNGAVQGDYDGDGTSDDTRIVFSGANIDLINVTTIQTNDAGQLSTPNNAPTVSLADSNLSYTVSAVATQIDSSASVSDADGDSHWNGGTLTAQIIANSTANDTLSLSGTNIEITGSVLKYSGASIGTVSASSVTGGSVLTITFNSGSTNAIVQTIARNLRFYTTNSGSSDRVVKFVVTDKNGSSAEDTRGIDVSGAATITYYTVSTNAGTGGSISPSSRSIASGATDSFSITASPGYAISSVSGCSGSLSGTTYTTAVISGDCTVTASFSANSYSIVFDSQGGDSVATITQAYTTSVTLPDGAKTGYTLSSWNTQSNGGGTSYSVGQTLTMPVNGLTLYAQWTIRAYAVTYDGNENTSGTAPTDSSSPYHHNTEVTVLQNTGSLAKTGYAFSHWNTVVNGSGTSYAPEDTFTISGVVTLYAQWTANTYTLSFAGNGSTSGLMDNQSFTYGVTQNLTANSYARSGFTFSGWNTSANGTGTTYTDGQSVSNATSTNGATITLYAQWTAVPGGGGLPPIAYVNPQVSIESQITPSMTLNDDQGITYSSRVKVSFKDYHAFTPPITRFALSNTADFKNTSLQNISDYEKNGLTWDLCFGRDACSYQSHTVYVKFYSQWGRSSPVYARSIIFKEMSIPKVASNNFCSTPIYLTKAIKYKARNNATDVRLLERFLNAHEGYALPVDGIYSLEDRDAVIKWQEKHSKDILEPWGIAKGTGYVYLTSLRKIKQIHMEACTNK